MQTSAAALTEPAVQEAPSWRDRAALALVVAWVPVMTALQLVRMPGQRPWRALIAEDGRIFLADALRDPVGSLAATYNGYYQFVCRALASLASAFPLADAAVVLAVSGAAVASLLSLYVYATSASVFRSRWARFLLAALMLLTPAAVFEMSGNVLEVHWYFLFACFWALWTTRQSTAWVATDTAVVALTAWSTPLAALYFPLVVRRALIDRGRGRYIVCAAWAVGVGAQILYSATHEGAQRFSELGVRDIPILYFQRVVTELLVGEQYIKSAWIRFGWPLVVIAVLVTAAICIWGVLRGRDKRVFIIVAAGYSVLLTVVSLVIRGTAEAHMAPGQYTPSGSRYFFVPVLFLTAVFIGVADSDVRPRWLRAIPALLVAAVAAANVSITTAKGNAPSWRTSVRAARAECQRPSQQVRITIAPLNGGWFVPVRCSRVRGF